MSPTARALLARVRASGVRLVVREGRLRSLPSGRLPGPLAAEVRTHAKALAALVMDAEERTLDASEEASVCASEERAFRLYVRAASTRARTGSGWPGAAERDAAFRTARDITLKLEERV